MGEERPTAIRGEPRKKRTSTAPRKRESITVSFEARDYLDGQEPDPALALGASNAIRTCLGLEPGDTLLLIVQFDHLEAGAALLRAAESLGVEVTPYVVDRRQAENEAFVARLLDRLSEAKASCLVGDPPNLPEVFQRQVLQVGSRGRHARMVGLTPEMMSQSMRADYQEVHALGERVASALRGVRELCVESAVGTQLKVRLATGRAWRNESGLLSDPGWTELPGGEVHTAPASVDGVLVPDGGLWLSDGSELAKSNRVHLHFAGGLLERVEAPPGIDAAAFLDPVTRSGGEARISRVALGTNAGVLASIGALLQDRKMPGFHLTLGGDDGQEPVSGASLLLRRADVRADGTALLVRGRYGNALR